MGETLACSPSGNRHLVLMCVVDQRWEHCKYIPELCLCEGLCSIPVLREAAVRGARLRVPTSFSYPQNQVQSSRNRLSLSVTLSSFPLLLVLIRQGFVCNQTPSCCCTRGLSQSSGFDDPGAAQWCWEGEFALEMRMLPELAVLVKEVKYLNSRVGRFPRAG